MTNWPAAHGARDTRDAIYICNALYSAAMLTVLRDTLGYGQRRLKHIFERVQKLFGEVMDGYVSYADWRRRFMTSAASTW